MFSLSWHEQFFLCCLVRHKHLRYSFISLCYPLENNFLVIHVLRQGLRDGQAETTWEKSRVKSHYACFNDTVPFTTSSLEILLHFRLPTSVSYVSNSSNSSYFINIPEKHSQTYSALPLVTSVLIFHWIDYFSVKVLQLRQTAMSHWKIQKAFKICFYLNILRFCSTNYSHFSKTLFK